MVVVIIGAGVITAIGAGAAVTGVGVAGTGAVATGVAGTGERDLSDGLARLSL